MLQDDGQMISAFELAFGRKAVLTQPENYINKNELLMNRSRRMEFERLWKSQYLGELRKLKKFKSSNIKIGDFVLCPELLAKRSDWKTAIIVDVFWGKMDFLSN